MNDFKPRLWPALAILIATIITASSTPFLFTRTLVHFVGLIGAPMTMAMLIPLWWIFFSRVKGAWRWWPVLAYVLPLILFWAWLYRGEEPALGFFIAAPIAALWVVWLVIVRNRPWRTQRRGLIAVLLVAFAVAACVRIDGTDAAMWPDARLFWQPSAKERFERSLDAPPSSLELKQPQSKEVKIDVMDFAEFRGPLRDNVIRNARMNVAWDKALPKELWRHPVGAGWGSFSVVDERAYTLEQRGDSEAVVCYHSVLGHQLWEHRYPAKFTEFIAKEGPRSTPTIADGQCFSYGATGLLTCLDAASGKLVWQKSVVETHGATVPQWGFAASPLVLNGKAIIFTAVKGKAVAAFDAKTGEPRWANGNGEHGYSSAHRAKLHAVDQVLMVSDFGLESFHPDSGAKLWEHEWHFKGQNRVAQPTLLGNNEILLGTAVGNGQGARKLKVNFKDDKWSVDIVWNARSPKPYFNDGVVLDGHYYGFDDRNFVCIDLKDGRVKWNARDDYAFGQVILLADQKVLIVQSEKGPVALVSATPEDFNEIARLPALADKTWNHPVVCRGRLYLRNAVEAVCYDLGNP